MEKNLTQYLESKWYWHDAFNNDINDKDRDEKTKSNYNSVILDYLSYLEIEHTSIKKFEDITANTIIGFFHYKSNNYGKEIKASTKLNSKKVLKLFFKFISRYSQRENNNIERINFYQLYWEDIVIKQQRKVKVKTHDPESLENIMEYLEKRVKNRRTYFDYTLSLVIKLCYYGGLRASEVCGLHFSNFKSLRTSLSGEKIIDVEFIGKGNVQSSNPINYKYIKKEYNYFKREVSRSAKLRAKKILEKQNNNKISSDKLSNIETFLSHEIAIAGKKIRPNKDTIFFTKSGKILNRFTLYRYTNEISKKLNLAENGIHILRRTFATDLVELGVDINHVQQLMRHSNIQTTMVYLNRAQSKLDEAIGRL